MTSDTGAIDRAAQSATDIQNMRLIIQGEITRLGMFIDRPEAMAIAKRCHAALGRPYGDLPAAVEAQR